MIFTGPRHPKIIASVSSLRSFMLAFGRPAILSERRGAEALRAESDSSSLGFFELDMLAKTSIIMLLLSLDSA